MQFTLVVFVVVAVLVAILAQLELDSEPLIAQRSATLSSDKHETFRMVTDLSSFHKVFDRAAQRPVTGCVPNGVPNGVPLLRVATRVWMTFIVYVAEDLDASPHVKMGKPFRMYATSPIGKIELAAKITKHHSPSQFEFETRGALVAVRSTFDLQDGTMAGFSKLTWKIYSKRKSYLYWVTVVQPLKFVLSQQVTASLFNLKVLMQ